MNLGFSVRIRERTPLVMQAEAAECGLACLAMVLGYYGFVTDLRTMRHKFAISIRGMTLLDIKQMAQHYDLSARSLRAKWDHIYDFGCPSIAHWDDRHFIVVTRIKGNRAVIFDPAKGTYTVSRDEFEERSSGIFLLLTPTEKFERSVERTKIRLRNIIPIHHPLLGSLWQIFLASLMMEGVALLLPMFFQFGIDKITISGDASLLAVVAGGFLFLVFFEFFINVLRGRIIIFLKARLNLDVDSTVYEKLLSLPQKYFDTRHPGDTLSRFYSLRFIQDTLSTSFVQAVLDGVLVIGTLILMSFYSIVLTSIIVALYCAYLLVRGVWYRYLRNVNEVNMMALAQRETELVESIRGIQAIKVFGKEDNRLARWVGRVVTSVNAEAKVGILGLYYSGTNQLIMGVSNVLVIWIGVLWILRGEMTIGMLVAFMVFKNQFISKGSSLLDSIIKYVTLQVHISRVGDIVAEEPEKLSNILCKQRTSSRVALSATGISYRYSVHCPLILNSLSFEVAEGECLAIKGPSGVGKSTLAKLMLGLMLPEGGEFRLYGQSYAALGLQQVRHMIGAVMQDDSLFEGSVLDNITFFEDDPDMQWVEKCASMAYIHEDISAMPMGYETLMGNMGSAFSGGQKQRVLIARALYKRPQLLLLDEATSHLDPASEHEVNKAVRSLSLSRILFAHRQSTLKLADRILDLADAMGSRDVHPEEKSSLVE